MVISTQALFVDAGRARRRLALQHVAADAFHRGAKATSAANVSDAYTFIEWTPTGVIPRIVHQSWPTRHVPTALARYAQSWRTLLPRWQHTLHTDADNAKLVGERYSWLLPAYNQMTSIQQADTARLLYMHAYGGVYADLDMELLQPLGPLLEHVVSRKRRSAILGQEPLAHAILLESQPRQVCNALLASEVGHPFWLWLVRRIARIVLASDSDPDPVGSTGPRMIESAVREWEARVEGEVRVYVAWPEAFYPLWDPGQADSFRERCQLTEGKGPGDEPLPQWAASYEVQQSNLTAALISLCARLRAEGFSPAVPSDGTAFAAHHWAHTWLNGPPDGTVEQLSDAAGGGGVEVGEASLGGQTWQALHAIDSDLGGEAGDPTQWTSYGRLPYVLASVHRVVSRWLALR